MTISIIVSDKYDGGNIKFIRTEINTTNASIINVILQIRPDVYTELESIAHMQYFSFHVTIIGLTNSTNTNTSTTCNKDKQIIHYIIENASTVSYPDAWSGTTIFYSTELDNDLLWKRNTTTFYTNKQLWWEHEHCVNANDESSSTSSTYGNPIQMYFCYFPPYTRQRHERFKNKFQYYINTYKPDKQDDDANNNSKNTSDTTINNNNTTTKNEWVQMSRHLNCTIITLGYTKMNNPIDCYKIGVGSLIGWIICRQHPGETMAEFYAEGLLKRLLQLQNNNDNDDKYTINNSTAIETLCSDLTLSQQNSITGQGQVHDTIVQQILQLYTLYIVPCMCPDGVQLGHLRTNSVGANLNREWATVPTSEHYIAPTIERSPEVYYVLEQINTTGCHFFLDVHGDEELPYNFTNSPINIPNWSNRLQCLHGAFTGCYSRVNTDMQCIYGYPPISNPTHVLNYMNIATHQIAYKFNCLSVTLEMPFKDCLSNSDPIHGWSPIRSQQLGSSLVDVLLYMEQYIRIVDCNDPVWNNMPVDDVYIPTKSIYDNENDNAKEQQENDDDDDDNNYNDEHFNKPLTRFYSDVYEKRKTDNPTNTTRVPSVNNTDNNNTLPSINEK